MSTHGEVTIRVEQRHIDAGVPFGVTHCPIALAAREAGYRTATMHYAFGTLRPFGTLRLVAMRGYHRSYFNIDAGKWAQAFDLRKPVKPASFVFETQP